MAAPAGCHEMPKRISGIASLADGALNPKPAKESSENPAIALHFYGVTYLRDKYREPQRRRQSGESVPVKNGRMTPVMPRIEIRASQKK